MLTGSPITDIRITLLGGRAHVKHTEGGDFRQATYRAVRQGLMQAESVLLEPWYRFRLEVPAEQVGRAMTDLQRMNGAVAPPETAGEETVLTGSAPVAGLRDYAREVAAYTRGRGHLAVRAGRILPLRGRGACDCGAGLRPGAGCGQPRGLRYLCSHGAGVVVPWREVAEHAHLESAWHPDGEDAEEAPAAPAPRIVSTYAGTAAQDRELQAIFERTYGAIRRRDLQPPVREPRRPVSDTAGGGKPGLRKAFTGEEYLLVDGYNIIFAWESLKKTAAENLDAARKQLCDLLCNYQGYRKCHVIVVFDAYRVKGGQGSVEQYHNITLVYTKEAETADTYIERATYELGREHRVRVATSDGSEQVIILGHGALRLSASAFLEEVTEVQRQIGTALSQNNQRRAGDSAMRSAMERAKEEREC